MSPYKSKSRLALAAACALLGLLSGCATGAGPAAPTAGAATPRQTASTTASVTSFAVRGADSVAYFDLVRMRKLQPKLADVWRGQMDEDAERLLEEVADNCGLDVYDAVAEAAFTKSDREFLLAARLTIKHAEALRCLGALVGEDGSEETIAGRRAVRLKGLLAVSGGDLFLVGTEGAVNHALRDAASLGGTTARIYPDTRRTLSYVRMKIDAVPGLTAFSVRVSDEGGSAIMSFEYHGASAADADLIAEGLRTSMEKAYASSGAPPDVVERWRKAVTVSRRVEGRCEVRLPLVASHDYLEATGELSGALMGAVARYRLEREAHWTLYDLASRVERVAKESPVAGRPVLPASAPLTPAVTPTKARSAREAAKGWQHPTWKKLDFEPDPGDTFAYQIETKPNRRSALVRAVGEVDGERRVYEIELRVDDGGRVMVGRVKTRGQ